MKADHLESETEECSFFHNLFSGEVSIATPKKTRVCLSETEKGWLIGFTVIDMPFKMAMNFNGSGTSFIYWTCLIGIEWRDLIWSVIKSKCGTTFLKQQALHATVLKTGENDAFAEAHYMQTINRRNWISCGAGLTACWLGKYYLLFSNVTLLSLSSDFHLEANIKEIQKPFKWPSN